MQEKYDILKASSFRFVSCKCVHSTYFDDYLLMLPRPGPVGGWVGGGGGGVPSPVYCRGCSIIIIMFC